jgi:hypothetical protein
VAETTTNRGKYRTLLALIGAADLRMLVFTGTQTGVNDPDLNTVADLDAVTSVAIHSERIALSSVVATEDDVNNRGAADCADITFAAAPGVTAQGVAIYDHTGGADNARDLIFIYTSNYPQPMDGGLVVQIADILRAT